MKVSKLLLLLVVSAMVTGLLPGVLAQAAPTPCVAKDVTLAGTDAGEPLTGTVGPDVVSGLDGNDVLAGDKGDDRLCGGPGDDILGGGEGTDYLRGGLGNDVLIGGLGSDGYRGGAGIDICEADVLDVPAAGCEHDLAGDLDGDGTSNGNEILNGTNPFARDFADATESVDEDEVDTTAGTDADLDEVDDETDNCLGVSNTDQTNSDRDGSGDACDNDDDNDQIVDEEDLCPTRFHGDRNYGGCPPLEHVVVHQPPDLDHDDDGIDNDQDNCPLVANPDQEDSNENGVGNACEKTEDDDIPTFEEFFQDFLEENGVICGIIGFGFCEFIAGLIYDLIYGGGICPICGLGIRQVGIR